MRYMARWRTRALLAAWQGEGRYQQAKRQVWQAAVQQSRRSVLAAALGRWQAVAAEEAARRRALQRAGRLLRRLLLQQVLAAWRDAVGSEAAWRQQVAAAKQLRRRQLAQRAFHGWQYVAWFCATAAAAQQRRCLAVLAGALAAWRHRAAEKAATAMLLAELQRARAVRLVGWAFGAWAAFVEGRQARARDEELSRCSAGGQWAWDAWLKDLAGTAFL